MNIDLSTTPSISSRVFNFYKGLISAHRKQIFFMFLLFCFGSFVGALTYQFQPGLLQDILKFFQDKFGDLTDEKQLAYGIFQQNIQSAMIALFGGLILGLMPVVFILVNGFLLGFVIIALFAHSDQSIAQNVVYTVLGLAPHGIFEIPAVLIASAFGWNLGTRYLIHPQVNLTRWQEFKQGIKHALLISPFVIFLLIIAAVVEVYVTGYLLDLWIN